MSRLLPATEMAFRTYRIGRERDAEIRLGDASVSRHHAELTVTSEGRYYLTDRGSRHGTWILRDGRWREHRQGYVKPLDDLRFGKFEVRIVKLLEGRSLDSGTNQTPYEPVSVQPRRNLETGEVEV